MLYLYLILKFLIYSQDQLLENLIKKYEKINCIKVNFSQIYYKKSAGITLNKKGVLYIKKPKFLRFDYTYPEKIYYYSDGIFFYQFIPKEKLVYKMSILDTNNYNPFKFLSNISKLNEDFKLISQTLENDTYVLSFSPIKNRNSYLESLKIFLKTETLEIIKMYMIDPIGDENIISFQYSDDTYKDLPDSLFIFSIPKNIMVKELN